MSNKQIIGGWSAMQNGFEPGKQIEYELYQVQNKSGQMFNTFKLFKLFQITDQQTGERRWVQGTSFGVNAHYQMVDRLNHMINTSGLCKQKGVYVFQPVVEQQFPQQQQMQPQQPYPQQGGYGMGQPQQQIQPPQAPQQGGQYQPPPQQQQPQPQPQPFVPNGDQYPQG